MTCFIAIYALLWWLGTEPKVSLGVSVFPSWSLSSSGLKPSGGDKTDNIDRHGLHVGGWWILRSGEWLNARMSVWDSSHASEEENYCGLVLSHQRFLRGGKIWMEPTWEPLPGNELVHDVLLTWSRLILTTTPWSGCYNYLPHLRDEETVQGLSEPPRSQRW